MEYLLQKAFEGASQKYTPEQMAAILDKMVEAHNYLAKLCYGWGLVFIACFTILVVLAIRSELNYRKIKKRLDVTKGFLVEVRENEKHFVRPGEESDIFGRIHKR